jgi:acetate kinase
MILLIRPDFPFMEFCRVQNGRFFVNRVAYSPEEITTIVDETDKIEAVGHFLFHGGTIFKDTVNELDESLLDKIEKSVVFSPENNGLTLKIARILLEKLPRVPQVLFCDTAYFSDLPEQASTYAVSHIFREYGIRRHGGYGLLHCWIWEKVRFLSPDTGAIISVHLGDNPNIVAIRAGKPVETTIGFTPVEGLLSSTSCGDVDPTIVFQLHSKGVSFEDIAGILSNESGFKGLTGEECGYLDVLSAGHSGNISAVKRILYYNIIRYIGAFTSVLGGVDKIVFVSKHLLPSMEFIREICANLGFIGLSDGDITVVKSGEKSCGNAAIGGVLCVEQSQWSVMAQEITDNINREARDE